MKPSLIKRAKKGLIIHHWDTDGLSSTALFLNYFKKLNPQIKLEYRPPIINNYFLTDLELTQITKEGYDFILAVDINFSKETIEQLKKISKNFYWFDHHHQDQKIKVAGKQDDKYLSCAHLISDQLEVEDKLLAVLGMIGDQEEKVKENKLVKSVDVSFEDLMQIKKLIDSNYIVGNYRGIKETVRILQDNPLLILENLGLQNNLEKIKAEEKKALKQKPEIIKENVLVYHLESPYNILSSSTRLLAKENQDKIILSSQSHNGHSNVYLRSARPEVDFRELVGIVKQKGYKAGGKKEVIGIVVETKKLNKFKEEISKWIIKNYLS